MILSRCRLPLRGGRIRGTRLGRLVCPSLGLFRISVSVRFGDREDVGGGGKWEGGGRLSVQEWRKRRHVHEMTPIFFAVMTHATQTADWIVRTNVISMAFSNSLV